MIMPSSALFLAYNNEYCGICDTLSEEQYVFVQYYDVVPEEAVTADRFDEKMKFIWLNSKQYGEAYAERKQGEVFV